MGYLRNRLIQAFITLFGIVTLGFVFIRLMPGGPAQYLRSTVREEPEEHGLGSNPTGEEVRRYIEANMVSPPEQPLWQQYIDYLVGVFTRADFGISYIVEPQEPVMSLIIEAAPWTIFLSSVSLVYGLVVGIVLGSVMAYYNGTRFDVGMTTAMILNGAVPFYVAAILLLYFLSYQLGWFPSGSRYPPGMEPDYSLEFILGVFHHAALPCLSMIITGFGGGALGMRAHSVRIMGSDYIEVARLRGLSSYKIATRYLARNAMLPMYTGIMLGLGGLLGGSVILEGIFAYPGLGLLMFDATVMRDFPLLTASMVVTSALFILGTLMADFTYSLIDPRAEQASMG